MRFKRTLLLLSTLFSLVTVTIVMAILSEISPGELGTGSTTTEPTLYVAPYRHVTKSMTQLGRMDEVNRHFLFLNHVPKCGSEILILLLQRLQGHNNFRHVRLKWGNKRFLNRIQQEQLVDELYDTMKKEAVPLSFDRHVFFINFTTFDKQLPTYINLIRDPVERIISRISFGNRTKDTFYYKCLVSERNNCNFKNGKPYDLSIPYFCGQHPNCKLLNNEWAYQEARNNVERYYPVVGVLEELHKTLEILEKKIPYFFKGVKELYFENFHQMHKINIINDVPAEAKAKLTAALSMEIDFYQWVKSRLLMQSTELLL